MLINLTNHPYEMWSDSQKNAALEEYGEVYPMPFPAVEPSWTTEKLWEVADEYADKIEALKPDAVLAAGEMTFLFIMVDRLLKDGIKVVCSCSKRTAVEEKKPDGTIEKKSVFSFECFREYSYYVSGENRPR